MMVAWALLLPHITVACIERDARLLKHASEKMLALSPSMQQRIHFHNCHPLNVQSEWCNAEIIVMNMDGFDACAIPHVINGCQGVPQGTRIVMLWKSELRTEMSRICNFALIHHAKYSQDSIRGNGNALVDVYVKL
jgi:hypothetical protein